MTGEKAWMRTVLARLAAELPKEQHEVWMLRVHGKSFQDIGDILGITKQAAHGRYARAKLRATRIADEEASRDRTPQ